MPTRDYDPRRYGPTADVGALAASRGLQSASVAKDGFHSVQEESGTAGGARVRGGAGVLIGLPASSRGGVRPHVLLSFPDDASAPRKDRCGIFLEPVVHLLRVDYFVATVQQKAPRHVSKHLNTYSTCPFLLYAYAAVL